MNGELFLTVAAELVTGTTEAHYRSAVSRAYYGAFHAARRLLADIGVFLPKGELVHTKVTYCLQDCGEPTAAECGVSLESLRTERNRADYDVDRTPYDREVAAAHVKKARQIVLALQVCRSGANATEVRAKVRSQARLLGLTVSSPMPEP
jgi:uncharacterized protein (UPF0332 family)